MYLLVSELSVDLAAFLFAQRQDCSTSLKAAVVSFIPFKDWRQQTDTNLGRGDKRRVVSNSCVVPSGLLCRGVLWPPPPRGQWGGAGGSVPVRGRGGVLVFWRLRHGGRRKEQVSGERHLDAASHMQR